MPSAPPATSSSNGTRHLLCQRLELAGFRSWTLHAHAATMCSTSTSGAAWAMRQKIVLALQTCQGTVNTGQLLDEMSAQTCQAETVQMLNTSLLSITAHLKPACSRLMTRPPGAPRRCDRNSSWPAQRQHTRCVQDTPQPTRYAHGLLVVLQLDVSVPTCLQVLVCASARHTRTLPSSEALARQEGSCGWKSRSNTRPL